MQVPLPTEHHRRLTRLVGLWTGEVRPLHGAGGAEEPRHQGVLDCRLACGDLFLVSDYLQLAGGRAVFRGHGVYGWDATESCHTMYWFDSMSPSGFTQVARGRWEDEILTFEHVEPRRVRYVYRFEAGDRVVFRIEVSQDGATWQGVTEVPFARA